MIFFCFHYSSPHRFILFHFYFRLFSPIVIVPVVCVVGLGRFAMGFSQVPFMIQLFRFAIFKICFVGHFLETGFGETNTRHFHIVFFS